MDDEADTPKGEAAIRAAVAAASEPPRRIDERALADLPRNDFGNSERLRQRYGENLVVTGNEAFEWLCWDGKRFARAGGFTAAQQLAHQTAEAIHREADALAGDAKPPRPDDADAEVLKAWQQQLKRRDASIEAHHKWAVVSGNIGKVNAMLESSRPYLRREARDLDAHPFMLNTLSGTLDLDARPDAEGRPVLKARPPARGDLLTKICGTTFDPEATCPHWDAFLAKVLPDREVRAFLQRYVGYCLTGDTSEQALLLCHGTGANGKSTAIRIIGALLGDYAVTLSIKSFMHDDRKRAAEATPDLALLAGARLVTASEPELGDRFSESIVKTITGGEDLVVRPLFKDQYTIAPQFKLILAANIKPGIRGSDLGIWRRIKLLPFTETIPAEERIAPRELIATLMAELPGILNWAIDGYLSWREGGLGEPDAIREATEEYRRESDSVGEFMRDCTNRVIGHRVEARRLYDVYVAWAKANAIDHVTQTLFGKRLIDKGYSRIKASQHIYLDLEITWEGLDATGGSGGGTGGHGGAGDDVEPL